MRRSEGVSTKINVGDPVGNESELRKGFPPNLSPTAESLFEDRRGVREGERLIALVAQEILMGVIRSFDPLSPADDGPPIRTAIQSA